MTSKSGPGPEKNPRKANPIRSRILDGIAYLVRHQAVGVVTVAALLVGLSLYYTREVPIHSSYLDLLPKNDPLIEEYKAKEEELTATDYAAVLLSLTSPPRDVAARKERLRQAADKLIPILLEEREIVRASYRIGEEITYPDELLLFQRATPEDLETLQKAAEEIMAVLSGLPAGTGSLPEQFQRLKALLSQQGEATPEALLPLLDDMLKLGEDGLSALEALPRLRDPLHRAAQVISRLETLGQGQTEAEAGTELFSQDGTKLVVQVWPRQPSYAGLLYCQLITRTLADAIARAGLEDMGVKAGITGAYVVVAETNAVIRRDMNFTTWVSSLGVLLLLSLTFASAFLTLVALFPLLVSALLTVAWAKLSVGGFNLVTTFLPALVLGLGIDFSIHLLARYVEERKAGRTVGKALDIAIHRKGEASLSAALTTAAVFLALLISRSRALEEMGVIMSVGIVVAYLAAMMLTPSLIALSYVSLKRRFKEWLPLQAGMVAPLYRNLLRQGRAVVALTLGLTLALSYQVSQVQFKFASQQLAPRTKAAEVAQEILRELPGEVSFGDQFVFFVKDPAKLHELEEELAANPLVVGTDSLRELLPQELLRGKASLQDIPVDRAAATLAALEVALDNWGALVQELEESIPLLSALEFSWTFAGKPDQAAALSDRLKGLISLHKTMEETDTAAYLETVRALRQDMQTVQQFVQRVAALPDEPGLLQTLVQVLPAQLKGVYYSTASQAFLLRARMSPALYEGKNLQQFVHWAHGLGVEFFGVPEVQARLEAYMKRDFALSTAVAALLIALLVWTSFGSLGEALLALSPLAIGYLWMLAGMKLLGIAFNFTNIVISPLLIGIGVDSAIHILHRIEEERGKGVREPFVHGPSATLVPTLSTSLTTMLVFGTLIAARTPGLRYLGISALLGLGFTLLASVMFLPCAAAWLDRRRRGD